MAICDESAYGRASLIKTHFPHMIGQKWPTMCAQKFESAVFRFRIHTQTNMYFPYFKHIVFTKLPESLCKHFLNQKNLKRREMLQMLKLQHFKTLTFQGKVKDVKLLKLQGKCILIFPWFKRVLTKLRSKQRNYWILKFIESKTLTCSGQY